jgi:hypothetical protein
VAVLAALVTELDATGSELPPLWPRVFHCFLRVSILANVLDGDPHLAARVIEHSAVTALCAMPEILPQLNLPRRAGRLHVG